MRALWRGEKRADPGRADLHADARRACSDLAQVMRRLTRARASPSIFITHKLCEAYELGDRISVLRLGRLVGQLPPERLQGHERSAGHGRGHPPDVRQQPRHDAATPRPWSAAARPTAAPRHRSQRAAAAQRSRRLRPRPRRGECPLRDVELRCLARRDPRHRRRRRQRPEASGRGAGRPAPPRRRQSITLDGADITRRRACPSGAGGHPLHHRRAPGRGHGRRRSRSPSIS